MASVDTELGQTATTLSGAKPQSSETQSNADAPKPPVETRDDSGEAREICRRLDHAATRAAVTAERAVLATLGGGCQVPIGAYAMLDGSVIHIRSIIVSPDGEQVIRKEASGPAADAVALGRALGNELLAAGGAEILKAVYGA